MWPGRRVGVAGRVWPEVRWVRPVVGGRGGVGGCGREAGQVPAARVLFESCSLGLEATGQLDDIVGSLQVRTPQRRKMPPSKMRMWSSSHLAARLSPKAHQIRVSNGPAPSLLPAPTSCSPAPGTGTEADPPNQLPPNRQAHPLLRSSIQAGPSPRTRFSQGLPRLPGVSFGRPPSCGPPTPR